MIPDARELMPDLEREVILKEAKPFDPLTRFENLAKSFPQAIQILRIGGVHPTENSKMDNPYTGKPDNESFTNIGEHCAAVTSLSLVVASRLYTIGLLASADIDSIGTRSLVHDANKRIEIMRRNAVREGVIEEAYTPKAYETIRPILQAQGLNQELIEYMAGAGRETGHLSLKDFLTLEDGIPSLVPGRMVDKIVHLADDMTSTSIPEEGQRPMTIYLTTWERMTASEFPKRYTFLWKEGLGFDPDGQVITIPDVTDAERNLRWVRPYAYWQPFVSNEICREIQSMIAPDNKLKPEVFVKNMVNHILLPTS